MNIDGVTTGIVLDHIEAGKSMEIYELLKLDRLDCSVAIIQNADSTKYGKKDIIKIDEDIPLDFAALGYLDNKITVNRVHNHELVEKLHLELPHELVDIIACNNPRCITSVEPSIVQKFKLVNPDTKEYHCIYCDSEYHR
ncbi:aspartate carbamoyltransferase regulatory subunit [Allofustis seminis]|uniref:aspartate carbamoyltransferase regulatory subunit n=1 Tax=Allofustis seminis TaxID=166939 RepID=UPI00037C0F82|nr:aspartate carbamoyltransferase regulatory subunit [Allofustis seminis]